MIYKKLPLHVLLNIISIIFLVLLPYYLFEGKLFVGGDDTRLFYAYPFEFLKNVSYYSWYNVSSVGIYVSNQYLIPFLSIWSLLDLIFSNRILLSYLAFSLPLILGLIYFPKFVKEYFSFKKEYNIELFIGSLFYILSPILIFDQLFIFLTSAWLIGLFPALGYYFLRYVKTAKIHLLYIAMCFAIIFGFTLLAVPWVLGLLLPLGLSSLILILLGNYSQILTFIKRSLIFGTVITLSQSYWFLGFITPYIFKDNNSFAQRFLSESFVESFKSTVNSTASGSIIYPLLNLFHRQIAFDYDWKLKNEFINVYDKTFLLNGVFLVIIAIGILSYKKYLSKFNRRLFVFTISSFVLSLFFFTVNIGPLKQLFLSFGYIPGFVMFRNFYDKFAPGYIFIYSLLFTISLVIVSQRFPRYKSLFQLVALCVVLFNFTTVKSTVNSPLWTTENIYKTITLPQEYLLFMKDVKNKVSPSNTILSLPFGTSVYTVVKDETSDNVYVGISPVKIFSGVNDISGHLSFNFTEEAGIIDSLIVEHKLDEFNKVLYAHNVNYVIHTKNIPDQVMNSYAFGKDVVASQDARFLNAITGKKIHTSKEGNYDLYTTKRQNTMLSSNNLRFQKINSVSYKIYLENISKPQNLSFNDSYHAGWKLFLDKNPSDKFCNTIIFSINSTSECTSVFKFVDLKELTNLWRKTIFSETHSSDNGVNNTWEIDPEYVRKNMSAEYYSVNKDGSINIEMTLYFMPQLFFYYGAILSFITVLVMTVILIRVKQPKK